MLLVWGSIGGVIIVGGGLAAFFVLRSVPPAPAPTPPAPAPVNVAPAPAPTPPVNVAPPAPEPEPEPEPAPAADQDTDRDGLTDAEELLLGTDINLADSDSDGYSDSVELSNLYNPAGIAPQRLLDAGIVYEYEHPTQRWAIYLPRQWSIAATDQEQRELTVSTETPNEQIVIHVSQDRTLGTCASAGLEVIPSKRGAVGCRSTSAVPFEGEGEAGYVAEFPISELLVVRLGHLTITPPPRYPHAFDMILQSFSGPPRGGPIE